MREKETNNICLWKLLGQNGRIQAREENNIFQPNHLETACVLCTGYGVYAINNEVDICNEYLITKKLKRDTSEYGLSCGDGCRFEGAEE